MSTTPLSRPISTLMRGTYVVDASATLGLAASKLRENSAGVLPVVSGQHLVGVISEKSLAEALGRGAHDHEGVEAAFLSNSPLIRLYESGAEALRSFESTDSPALIVVDDSGQVAGVLRPSDLLDPPKWRIRPPLIGGMATPFGVYLTSGSIGAGTGGLSLVATGAMLFTILSLATAVSLGLHIWLAGLGMKFVVVNAISSILQLALFAASFRLLPIAGIHAAEHMVVHTIERGEPLLPGVVKRMPRVHPRCGTNLAVGASLFLGIATSPIPNDEMRLILALVVTTLLWRRVGGFVQYWITTRPPTDRQIELGIKAGKELLDRQAHVHELHTPLIMRIWNSGMFHVMAGSLLVLAAITGISALFGIEVPL
jgi:CBS domain-containing protein